LKSLQRLCTGCKSSICVVIGVGKATKKLSEFLDCVKVRSASMNSMHGILNLMPVQEYRTTALLGCETDSFDSEGAVVRVAHWKHVTREKVEEALPTFRGDIQQKPPMYVLTLHPCCKC
jgi:tRNA pseudouridine55 synthase